MKGMIDQYGCLVIHRKSGPGKQLCPFSSGGLEIVQCGDSCPHFDDDLSANGANPHVNLTCGNYGGMSVSIEITEDMRPVKKEEEGREDPVPRPSVECPLCGDTGKYGFDHGPCPNECEVPTANTEEEEECSLCRGTGLAAGGPYPCPNDCPRNPDKDEEAQANG